MKSLLWVEESLIKKLQLVDEVEEITKEDIENLVKEFNSSTEDLSNCVDSNVLEFRAKAQRVRDSYKKVVDEELEKTEEFWEVLDKKRYESAKQIKECRSHIDSISKDVDNLKSKISNINFYSIDRLIEVVEKISELDENQLKMLEKLFK